jgi:hypothetical protein
MILKKRKNVKKTRKSSDEKFYSAPRVTNDILAVILRIYLKKETV